MNFFVKKILFPVLTLASLAIITSTPLAPTQTEQPDAEYLLKSYKNTVALYCDGEIIAVYNDIVLNTLPEKDVQNFNTGVPVSTVSQAESYLEDFE